MLTDADILRDYVATRSNASFEEIIRRYVPLVYSTALRQVRNPEMAQDVAQIVFALLARKARHLSPRVILSGWLYRATYFVASRALRAEWRRQKLEKEAAHMHTNDPDPDWLQLAPVLDTAMAQLGDADRAALLMRFFQNQSLRQVGEAFGITDDTAQKRVTRALDKLRGILSLRGIAIPAVAVSGLLSAHAVQAAPPQIMGALAAAATNTAPLSQTAQLLLKQTLRRWYWAKVLASAAGVITLLMICSVALHFTAKYHHTSSSSVILPVRKPAAVVASSPDGLATIRFHFSGNSTVNIHLHYSADGAPSEDINTSAAHEITFRADAFTASLKAQGTPPFSFDIYRDDLRMAHSAMSPNSTNVSVSLEARKGGRGIRMSAEPGP